MDVQVLSGHTAHELEMALNGFFEANPGIDLAEVTCGSTGSHAHLSGWSAIVALFFQPTSSHQSGPTSLRSAVSEIRVVAGSGSAEYHNNKLASRMAQRTANIPERSVVTTFLLASGWTDRLENRVMLGMVYRPGG